MTQIISQTIKTLERLVAFESISHLPNLPVAEFLASKYEDLGFKSHYFYDNKNPNKANLICKIGPEVEGGLVVSGHMDVVPTKNQPWKSDPFVLTEKENKLYGRGTADMKGFLACTLTALSNLDCSKLTKPLWLVWTYDEEVGCQGSAKLAKTLKTTNAPIPKQALIGEPTDFRIFRMHPGHVTCKITTKGLAAHSSKPDLGKNAIKSMQVILVVLEKLEHDLMKRTKFEEYFERPFVTLNAGMIRGGQAVNIVPDKCELTIGYRQLPGQKADSVFNELSSRLRECNNLVLDSWEAKIENATPGLLTPENTLLQEQLTPFASNPKAQAASFATDGGNFTELGIQSLVFGPGSIDVAHKANEFIEIDALAKASHIVSTLVQQNCT